MRYNHLTSLEREQLCSWLNIASKWKTEQSNPYKSGEQWLFVNLAENACHLTQ
jgi:hypothetical protein